MLRQSAVAGEFYPENKEELKKMISGFLSKAKAPKINGEIFGLLLPHAGYAYSGKVAASGFKTIAEKNFDTVIIIADSHYERFDGVAVFPRGEWETPLGKIKIDESLAQKITAGSRRFFQRDSAHLWEHSIEVQLPFLQRTLKNFKILPIIFGSENKDWKLLAKTILESIENKKVLIIASADLSHYLSYGKAKEIDKKTLNNILNLKVSGLNICAIDSAKTIIEITKSLGGRAKLLKYANSGDTAAGETRVVGYGAVAFIK
ncbi:MAG: AmmeMemoRadiSam system protein B [bacterium]|nr:AmmeMemoRadiSam system protein B [bacterium]